MQVGALGCPNLNIQYLLSDESKAFKPGSGSIVLAVRGQGTWAAPIAGGEFVRLNVSKRSDASQGRMLRSLEEAHTNVGQIGELVTALNVQAEPVGMDSQAKYAVLAAGKGDTLVRLISAKMPDYKEKIWDQGAGSIVVEEAGGRITDLDGRTLDFTAGRTLAHNRGILASNGALHEAMLAGLKTDQGVGRLLRAGVSLPAPASRNPSPLRRNRHLLSSNHGAPSRRTVMSPFTLRTLTSGPAAARLATCAHVLARRAAAVVPGVGFRLLERPVAVDARLAAVSVGVGGFEIESRGHVGRQLDHDVAVAREELSRRDHRRADRPPRCESCLRRYRHSRRRRCARCRCRLHRSMP